jgi:hypothetical protein
LNEANVLDLHKRSSHKKDHVATFAPHEKLFKFFGFRGNGFLVAARGQTEEMTGPQSFHEDFHRKDEVTAGSERGLGIVFFAVFLLIGLLPLLFGDSPRLWSLGVAAVFLLVALFRPRLLSPLNRIWFSFGLLLHKIVTPVIMGLLFYLTVTPTGAIMRLMGKDPLHQRLDPEAETYWIERNPAGPDPQSMRNQF